MAVNFPNSPSSGDVHSEGGASWRYNGTNAVRYEKLVPILIEAIKELKKEIDEILGLE